MIDVVLRDGSVMELADATCVSIVGTELVCRNAYGEVVRRFSNLEAIMYGAPETIEPLVAKDWAQRETERIVTAGLQFLSGGTLDGWSA